jgi:hypothetical protein
LSLTSPLVSIHPLSLNSPLVSQFTPCFSVLCRTVSMVLVTSASLRATTLCEAAPALPSSASPISMLITCEGGGAGWTTMRMTMPD